MRKHKQMPRALNPLLNFTASRSNRLEAKAKSLNQLLNFILSRSKQAEANGKLKCFNAATVQSTDVAVCCIDMYLSLCRFVSTFTLFKGNARIVPLNLFIPPLLVNELYHLNNKYQIMLANVGYAMHILHIDDILHITVSSHTVIEHGMHVWLLATEFPRCTRDSDRDVKNGLLNKDCWQ